MLKKIILAAALITSLSWLPSVYPQNSQQKMRAALDAGDVLPLRTILDQMETSFPGRILAIELEQNQQDLVYEVKMLNPRKRVVKILIDAKTGEFLGHKHPRKRSDRTQGKHPHQYKKSVPDANTNN